MVWPGQSFKISSKAKLETQAASQAPHVFSPHDSSEAVLHMYEVYLLVCLLAVSFTQLRDMVQSFQYLCHMADPCVHPFFDTFQVKT